MEYQEYIAKADKDIYRTIVEEKNLEKLTAMLPDTESLVKFSNLEFAYPYRRNSILALLVKTNDANFFAQVWDE